MTKILLRKLAHVSLRLVLVVLLGAVLAAIAILIVIPRATHGTALTVLTGSMAPGIPVGSVVIDRPVDPGTLRVGDVATYQVAPGKADYITHRIAAIDTAKNPVSFTFKGDANRGPDIHPVPATAIRGKVWFHVPLLGAIRDGLHGKGGITLVAVLALGGYALSQLSGAFRERMPKKPATLRLERTLILATLDTAQTARAGQTPEELAQQWRAILLDSTPLSFRLLIAPPPDGVVAAAELLQTCHLVSIEVFGAPLALTGKPPSAELLAALDSVNASSDGPPTERDHAQG